MVAGEVSTLDFLADIATEDFRRLVQAKMRQQHLSQRGLADRAGIDHSTISRLLSTNKDPSLTTVVRIARALRGNP